MTYLLSTLESLNQSSKFCRINSPLLNKSNCAKNSALRHWFGPMVATAQVHFFTGSPGYDPNAAPQGPPRPGTAGTAGKNLHFSAGHHFRFHIFTLKPF
jgi:hypothetical protein